MTVYEITYRDSIHPSGKTTKISAYQFVLGRDWVLFRENDEDETVKLAVAVSDVLSIQDLGDDA